MQEIIDIFKGLLTPLIGVIAVYIAYQQYRTNRLREQRESRKAKLDVYRKVKRFLHDVDYSGVISKAGLEEFADAIAEADFLFPEDLNDWLDELHSVAWEWCSQEEYLSLQIKESGLTESEYLAEARTSAMWKKHEENMQSYIEGIRDAHGALKQKFSNYIELK